MEIIIDLRGAVRRIAVLVLAAVIFAFLVKVTVDQYVIFSLSDYRALVTPPMITGANDFRPNSPRLLAKLAEIELSYSDSDAELAEQHALQAISYSPNDFNNWLLLGKIRDARGDSAGAAEAIREALRLAPNDHIAHWRMANVLLREGKLEESLPHFRFVTTINHPILPVTLDLIKPRIFRS